MHDHERAGHFQPLIKDLYQTARNTLGFEPHPSIILKLDGQNASNPLGKTAHYEPQEQRIVLYVQGRHIKDILRSLAHELIHHDQNCNGKFNEGAATVDGYAQEDGHLREMEREAYENGNMIFRDWEDNLKKKGVVSLFTNKQHYVRPMMTDVIGGRMLEGNKMKKKLQESNLREIIRGVIQEMFNDDLKEGDSSFFDPKREEAEGEEELAQQSKPSGAAFASVGPTNEGTAEGEFDEDDPRKAADETPESSLDEDSEREEGYNDWKNEHADDDHIREMEHHLQALRGDRDYERHGAEYKKDESLNEDDEAAQGYNDWKNEHADDDHIREMEHHIRALKDDRDYERKGAEYGDEERRDEIQGSEALVAQGITDAGNPEESLNETFFPKDHHIRQKARFELNDALMKRWKYMIKG